MGILDDVRALASTGNYEEARALLERAQREEPGRADFKFTLGHVYWHLGRLDDAEACFQAAHNVNPTDPAPREEMAKLREFRRIRDRQAALRPEPPPGTPQSAHNVNPTDPAPRRRSRGLAPLGPDSSARLRARRAAPGSPRPALNDIFLPDTEEEFDDFARRDRRKKEIAARNEVLGGWHGLPWFVKVFNVVLFTGVLAGFAWILLGGFVPATVPDVRGLSEFEARGKLRNADFSNIESRLVTATELPRGAVAGTEPGAGSVSRRGATITLLVAGAQVKVPKVKGLSWGQATSRLSDAGINWEYKESAGTALGTDPPAGTLVTPNHGGVKGTLVLLKMDGKW